MARPKFVKADDFVCGFAAAIADLVRCFDQPAMAKEIMRRNGISVDDCEDAEVVEFDLAVIRKLLR